MNQKIIAKAKEAKSVEELLTLAKENNLELTEEQEKELFDRIHADGELSDDDMESVAGVFWLKDIKPNCYNVIK